MTAEPQSVATDLPRVSSTPAGAGGPSALARAWRRFLAVTRLSLAAVCEESAGLGPHDYHNYRDDADGVPWCAEGGARCRRCGKRFRL